MSRLLFPMSLFLSALLLFMIQPMVAKVLLPSYGGTPAVWTVCMLFFQCLLLFAYGYAWALSRFRGVLRWRVAHAVVCVLSLLALPLMVVPGAHVGVPELDILRSLFMQLGLPLLVVGTSAPLLQYAYAQSKGERARDPYFLYVASNTGSLLALLSYPLWIERYTGVHQQFYGWTGIYVLYLFLVFYVLFFVPYNKEKSSPVAAVSMPWSRYGLWIFLSFIPCSLMMGVTFFISTDIASTPMLWILPLALYLLSFIFTFARKPLIPHSFIVRNTLLCLVFPFLGFIFGMNQLSALSLIIMHLIGFFMVAMLCHGELVRSRPEVSQLTVFYFCLALGGVFAGLFNGLWAPRFLTYAYEYPLVLLLALLCLPMASKQAVGLWRRIGWMPIAAFLLLMVNYYLPMQSWIRSHHLIEILVLSLLMIWPGNTYRLFVGMAILFAFIFLPCFQVTHVLSQQRNFYGVKQVVSADGAHVLLSQTTVHGFQITQDESPQHGTMAYYGVIYPVVEQLQQENPALRAMVIGLGTGIMACQFREKDALSIVEIDAQVIDIASNSEFFTYLRDCPSHPILIKEDGLLAMKPVKKASLDFLMVDAFSSDAIPVHLLTLEAFRLYQDKITPQGVIAINISNRHLRLLPVLTGAARILDLIVLHKKQALNPRLGQLEAEWVLLTANESFAQHMIGRLGWRFVADPESFVWTNDYSNLLPLLKG